MKYCEIVYVDRMINGRLVPLMVMDSLYTTWTGCYCKI